MPINLTTNGIAKIMDGDTNLKPLLQVLDISVISRDKDRYRMMLSDSVAVQQAMIASQCNHLAKNGGVRKGSVVQLIEYICSIVQGRRVICVLNMEIIMPECEIIGNPREFLPSNPVSNGVSQQTTMPSSNRSSVTNLSSNTQTFRPTIQPAYQPPPMYKSHGSIMKNEAPARIIPISALNPYQGRWAIKARVTAKGDLRRYNNAKGDGKVFSFDLLDSDGGEIRVTCFNAVVDRFYELIEVGKVYMISKGSLKPAKKNFNHLNNEWEIFLESSSTIDPCPDEDASIPQQQFSFKPISEIETAENNSIIDVIGVVTRVDPSVPIQRKNGIETQKRTLKLIDKSARSVELTLWGAFCNREGQRLQKIINAGFSPVLAVKGGRVKYFCGKSVGTDLSTQLFINPNSSEAEDLRKWYHKGGGRDLTSQVEEQDRERLILDKDELEKLRKAEKSRLQAEAKAAEGLRNAELAAAAEAKRMRELERKPSRQDLQKVLRGFYENIKLSDIEKEERLKTLGDLKDMSEGYLSIVNGKFHVCGSVITGLSTKASDFNVTVITTEDDSCRPLDVLKMTLISHSQVKNIESFPRREPPFLNFDLNSVKYRVSVNGTHEILFSRILRQLQKVHHSFKPLVLMAKAWAKRQGVYKAKSWGLNAFSVYAFVIFFLQSQGLFPPLKQLVSDAIISKLKDVDYSSGQNDLQKHVNLYLLENNSQPSSDYEAELLFVCFLETFQGLAEVAEEYYMSTREGLWLKKPHYMSRDNLWVQDPFDVEKNLTGNTKMKHLEKISHKFKSSLEIVRSENYTTIKSMLGLEI